MTDHTAQHIKLPARRALRAAGTGRVEPGPWRGRVEAVEGCGRVRRRRRARARRPRDRLRRGRNPAAWDRDRGDVAGRRACRSGAAVGQHGCHTDCPRLRLVPSAVRTRGCADVRGLHRGDGGGRAVERGAWTRRRRGLAPRRPVGDRGNAERAHPCRGGDGPRAADRGVYLSRLHLSRVTQLARTVAGGDHDRCAVRRVAHRMVAARGGCSSHGVRYRDVPALSLDGVVVSLYRRSRDHELDRPRGRAERGRRPC